MDLQKVSFQRAVHVLRLLAAGRPRCLRLARALVADKKGIEIGGPSAVFRRWFNLPVYDQIAMLDNCDFTQNTAWASHTPSFCFSKRWPCGKHTFWKVNLSMRLQRTVTTFFCPRIILSIWLIPSRG